MTTSDLAIVVPADEGDASWFAGALMVRKAAGAETNGAFDLLDQTVPAGYAPPRHIHRQEDEAWYVLEGTVTFWCGERTFVAGAGAFVLLPRDVEHTFKAGDAGAHLLTFTAPSGFSEFVVAAGEPAAARVIPPDAPVDPARLAEIAARYGIEITGPPPA